ncbi:MAG: hypothetical protein HC828_06315 [Blastochloris sp.]|nr:hypothetical protein [Blastochloris sp.]
MPTIRVILIGGTSHTGKTTLAAQFATKYGWEVCSTDRLARHPGRPWRNDGTVVPSHVAEHYRSSAADALLEDVLAHYRRLWPTIAALIIRHATATNSNGLVVEGSALWPEFVATLTLDTVAAIWLTASDAELQSRILETSHFVQRSVAEQSVIRKFLERTQCYNDRMHEAVQRLGLTYLPIAPAATLAERAERCLWQFGNGT